MTWIETLSTLVCVLGISIGQILFKRAAGSLGATGDWTTMINSPWLVTALVIYGGATVLWVLVLRSAPLGLAYPLFALAFLFVPFLSWLALGEPMRATSLVGGLVIVFGVVIATRA